MVIGKRISKRARNSNLYKRNDLRTLGEPNNILYMYIQMLKNNLSLFKNDNRIKLNVVDSFKIKCHSYLNEMFYILFCEFTKEYDKYFY